MKRFIAGADSGGGDEPRPPVEAPDTLRSTTLAKVVDALCEGEIEGLVDGEKSVYLDGTPIQASDGSYNFDGIVIDARTGTQDQTHLEGFDETLSEVPVNVKIEKDSPVIRTISNENLDALDVKIMIPRLSFQSLETGDTNGTTVQVQLAVKAFDDLDYVEKVDDIIDGKSSSRYERSYRISLHGQAPWDLRVTRVTDDSDKSNLQNETYIQSYTEVIYTKLTHPNTALVGVLVDSAKFQNIPVRGYDCKLMRVQVPTNYDPIARTYTGLWDGTFKVAWSDNPAWAFYDLATNERYGLGEFLKEANVDKWSLYTISQYCDELLTDNLGAQEPRFTINAYIQTRREAFDVLRDMASVFRGMTYHAGTQLIAVQDSPADPVYQFTNANCIGGQFSYAGSGRKARHTVAVVAWNDPDDLYKQRFEYVADHEGIARYGVSQVQLTAFGCTSRSQAHRVGRWLLYTERMETDTITFRTGLEGAYVRPGDIVNVMDEYRAGARMGGRVKEAITTSQIELDTAFAFDIALAYNFSVVLPDGSVETQGILNVGGDQSVIDLSAALADSPLVDAIYVISSVNLVPAPYRILSITEVEPSIYELTGIETHPDKHDAVEQDLDLDPLPTVGDLGSQPPTNVLIEDYLYVDNIVRVRMAVSWDAAPHAIRYKYQYKEGNKNWSELLTTSINSFEVDDIIPGIYTVRVYSVGPLGDMTAPTEKVTELFGKLAPPSDVTNLQASIVRGGVLVTWDAIPDLDILHYEVRIGASWDDGTVLDYVTGTSYLYDAASGTTFTFHVRAKDTSQNYSNGVTTLVAQFTPPVAPSNFTGTQFVGTVSFNWDEVAGAAYYRIRAGTSWDFGVEVANTYDHKVTIDWLRPGSTIFWIKSYDYLGNASVTPLFTNIAVLALPNWNNIITSDQVALNWPGASINMTEASGYNQLDEGRSKGEYYYTVTLAKEFDAAVYIEHDVDVVVASNLTWASADFSWDSEEADIPWSSTGDLSTVELEHHIALPQALASNVVEAFRLDDNLVGEKSTTPNSDTTVTYSDCRFANGADIDDLEQIDWLITVPNVFSLHFNKKIDDAGAAQEFLSVVNASGDGLVVWYDPVNGEVRFDDHTGAGVAVAVTLLAGDIVFIGIAQTTTARRLFVQRIGYNYHYVEEAMTSVSSLNKVKLYGHL